MNVVLQALADNPFLIDVLGWAVLVASLAITIGWLWQLYR
jgi:hypothetical protein